MRRSLDSLARLGGLLWWLERRMRRQPTMLMFHRVLPNAQCRDYPFPSLVVSVDAFEAMVGWLARKAHVVPVREAIQQTPSDSSRAHPDRPTVAITFDDGYADNFELAAPILERHGLRATFYAATDFVRGDLLWYDRAMLAVSENDDERLRTAADASDVAPPPVEELEKNRVHGWVETLKRAPSKKRTAWLAALPEPTAPATLQCRPMTPEQLRELAARGHEVGSHTLSHEILPLLDDARLRKEIEGARTLLRDWLGYAVEGFCYPNGSHDERVVAAVRASGHAYAVTTQDPSEVRETLEDLYRLPRIDMNPIRFSREGGTFDLTAFRAELCGLHARLR